MGLCCVYAAFHIHRERQTDSQTLHAIGFSSEYSMFPVDTKMRVVELFIIAKKKKSASLLTLEHFTLTVLFLTITK